VGWNVGFNHATGDNDGASPNFHSRSHRYTARQPSILANFDVAARRHGGSWHGHVGKVRITNDAMLSDGDLISDHDTAASTNNRPKIDPYLVPYFEARAFAGQ
jgi:hypothetical protein